MVRRCRPAVLGPRILLRIGGTVLTLADRLVSAPAIPAPVVEVVRPMTGRCLPRNHGYLLFAALATVGWVGHGEQGVQVLPVAGREERDARLWLDARSRLVIRAPLAVAGILARLPRQLLDVGGSAVRVGNAEVRQLSPSARLYSRMVTIQRHTGEVRHSYGFVRHTGDRVDPSEFRVALYRKLAEIGVNPAGVDVGDARTLRVRDTIVGGFGVRLTGLNDADSLRLLSTGLGGRRRFGCGVFVPC